MNKVMTAALVAGGLMLFNSPEAAAHKEVRDSHQPPYYQYHQRHDVRRSKHMPRWLKHNESFRSWYRHTSLQRDRRLAWGELFDIYRWERRHGYRYNKSYSGDDYYREHKRRDGRREGRRNRH